MNDELEKLKGDKSLPLSEILKRTFKYIKPEMLSFIIALVLLGVNTFLDIISPQFSRYITDELVKDNINMGFIVNLAVLMFVIVIINQIFLYIESIVLQKCGQRIIYRLRNDIFEHIEYMSLNQFNEMPVGSLVTRVTSYTASMSDLFTNIFVHILKNITTIIGVYIIMFTISSSLSLMLTPIMIIVFVVSLIFSKTIVTIFN